MLEVSLIGGADTQSLSGINAPRRTKLPSARLRESPINRSPAATPLGGLSSPDAQFPSAAQSSSDEGPLQADTPSPSALVGNLAMETRRYTDLRRAYQRLDLQAKGMARYACDGDKTEGAKLHAAMLKDANHPLRVWLEPYLDAMRPLEGAIKAQEKVIADLAKGLPVAAWAKSVAGLGDRFLGLLVGECGSPVGEFRNPSCVWKRMGLAVIGGQRQRRVVGEAALEHGYVARRRALVWNIGGSIMKQQVRKNEDGTRFALGELGQVYLDRRAYLEKRDGEDAKHVHTHAKRYMEKRLLRQLWQEWRRDA